MSLLDLPSPIHAPSVLLLALLALVGCAGTSEPGPEATETTTVTRIGGAPGGDARLELRTESSASERTFDLPIGDVWDALVRTYQEMELAVTEAPEPRRRLRTVNLRVPRIDGDRMGTFLDCGTGTTGQRANYWDVILSLVTSLSPNAGGEGVRVHVELDARATPRGTSGNPVHCTSRGELERRLLNGVTRRVGSGPP